MVDNKKIRVCHFSSVHKATDIRIFHKECVSLANSNFDVILIAVGDQDTDTISRNVRVITLKNPFNSRIKRAISFSKIIYQKALSINADVYHFHDPELIRFGKKLISKGKKVIYDAHEDVPRQILTKTWIPKIIRKVIANLFEKYEIKSVKKFTAIIAATPLIENRFSKVNTNVKCIYNSPLLSEFDLEATPNYAARKLIYIGLITRHRGIVEIIEALDKLNASLVLAGKFESNDLKMECSRMKGWKKVDYKGVVGRTEIGQLLNSSSIGIVTLHPTLNYIDSLPIKMFEYMGASLPIVASNFPLWKDIVEKNNCGLTANPLNPLDIAKKCELLLDRIDQMKEMGTNGRLYVLKHFNWNLEEKKLNDLYHKIIN